MSSSKFVAALSVLLAILTLSQSGVARRPPAVSICDYYTQELLGNDSPADQYLLLTILVNTVVIGNYTQTPTGIPVPGIFAKAVVSRTNVNLLPYFSGGHKTTNVDGKPGEVNFLDSGGALPLTKNLPSNDYETCKSNQCGLLTHLYELFGYLLGCSGLGTKEFPSYDGDLSLYETHKFMNLSSAQVRYFIGQVGLAATALGVEAADVTAVATTLTTLFGQRCSPSAALGTCLPAEAQSVCYQRGCPLSSTPNCYLYKEPKRCP